MEKMRGEGGKRDISKPKHTQLLANQSENFLKANARCEIAFFSSVLISANVRPFPRFGMKIGSNPKPLSPLALLASRPFTKPVKHLGRAFGLQNATAARKNAFRSRFFPTNFKIPSVPRVLKTYEEYGPGKPFSAPTKKPESSATTATPVELAACSAAKDAISSRSFDCISCFSHR